MPKVSIITTTYNHQDFIAQTIESVLAQTYTDRELLIGDDSPDANTWNVIQKYVDKYPGKIKAWHHRETKGLVQNMKFLLEKIDPESIYVAFLEWDDMYTSDNLHKKLDIFWQYPEVGVVSSNTQFCDEFGKYRKNTYFFSIEYYTTPGIKNYGLKELLWNPWPPFRWFGNVMLKRNFIWDIMDISLWIYETEKVFIPFDLLCRITILPKTQTYNIKEKLLIYRQHNNNNSSPKHFKMWLTQLTFIQNLYKNTLTKEVKYLTILITSKILALEWKRSKSLKKLWEACLLFPLSHIVYKISIILDILKLKRTILYILHLFSSK